MRLNFGKIFNRTSKDRRMDGLVNIPSDESLWPPAWKETQYKIYDRFKAVPLPPPLPKIFGHEELLKRRSKRSFGTVHGGAPVPQFAKITLQQLSNILFYSCGEKKNELGSTRSKRIQPSAGARYPIEAYVLNFEEGELQKKCYHYNVRDHALEELWDIPIESRANISKYFAYDWSTSASTAIVLTGVVHRTVMKYGERGYKYTYIEAGAILNNIQNNTMIEGLGSVIMGGTNETSIEELLDLDGENETVIMGILIG